jgi:hypothetical protein
MAARKSKTAILLARYGDVLDSVAKWEAAMPDLRKKEVSITELLEKIPRGSLPPIVETFKRDLYEMKDLMRTIRKTTKSLRRDMKKTGSALFAETVDRKFVSDSIKTQQKIIQTVVRQSRELQAQRLALRSYLESFRTMVKKRKDPKRISATTADAQ